MASPPDPRWDERVRASFDRQAVMRLLGARIGRLEPGRCEIVLPWREELGQQDGFFHAGVQSTAADSAGGYAAYTLMPAGSRVLTVEYKMNFLVPAVGERLVARGEVLRSGRTLAVARLTVEAEGGGGRRTCAVGQQTLACLAGD